LSALLAAGVAVLFGAMGSLTLVLLESALGVVALGVAGYGAGFVSAAVWAYAKPMPPARAAAVAIVVKLRVIFIVIFLRG